MLSNACNALGDRDILKIDTRLKCTEADSFGAVGYVDADKTDAISECILLNVSEALRYSYALKVQATRECGITDTLDSRGDRHAFKCAIAVEGIASDVCNSVRDNEIGYGSVIEIKLLCVDQWIGVIIAKPYITPSFKVADDDLGKSLTTVERTVANTRDACGDGYIRNVFAAVKGVITYACAVCDNYVIKGDRHVKSVILPCFGAENIAKMIGR